MEATATLRYYFETPEKAQIACRTLSVGDDLKPQESKATFSTDGPYLVFDVVAQSPKYLKKAINTTIPSIHLVEKTIKEFSI